jgi:thioredoxin-related protein
MNVQDHRRMARHLILIGCMILLLVDNSMGQDRPKPDGSPVTWPAFTEALGAAKASGRIVLIDVYSPSCPWCRKIQKEIYTDRALQEYLYDTFELGRIDISVNTDTVSFKNYQLSSAQLGAGFGATGTPTTIFLEPDGDYITRLPGYHELAEFMSVLQWIGSESYQEMSFEDFLQAKE